MEENFKYSLVNNKTISKLLQVALNMERKNDYQVEVIDVKWDTQRHLFEIKIKDASPRDDIPDSQLRKE